MDDLVKIQFSEFQAAMKSLPPHKLQPSEASFKYERKW
jgi:hypothetical protein